VPEELSPDAEDQARQGDPGEIPPGHPGH
jgi:hypothetical protein